MALSLSRKEGESIEVDGPAVIRIKKVGRRRVYMDITAPPTTRIRRPELPDLPDDEPEPGPDLGGES